MTAVIQRVLRGAVTVDGTERGACGRGVVILLGVAKGDTEEDARLLSEKIRKLRIFEDEDGKMNRSVTDIGGGALVVSNFTLLADYSHGNRPSFFDAEEPSRAAALVESFAAMLEAHMPVGRGVFGADMQVTIEGDGPVTIVMDSAVLKKKKG